MRTIAIITGTRAEFGLLRPVMHAIAAHPQLTLRTIVTGTHLLPPALTINDITKEFTVDCEVPIQRAGVIGRHADAEALGRGVIGITQALAMLAPDIALVLGDRIEALAGALAASVAGFRLAHIHGGDRAEGIADEAMRHAITKLAHLHLPATEQSAQRIIAMGETPEHVHVVGSPAIDGLADIAPMNDDDFAVLGEPEILFLMHPENAPPAELAFAAATALAQCTSAGRTLAMMPNHDPGREHIVQAIASSGCPSREHFPRNDFVGLLRRVRVLVGNSSAGLIEAPAIGVPVVNLGRRQSDRESAGHVRNVPQITEQSLRDAIHNALSTGHKKIAHPFGDGRAGDRIADNLAGLDFAQFTLAKRNTY